MPFAAAMLTVRVLVSSADTAGSNSTGLGASDCRGCFVGAGSAGVSGRAAREGGNGRDGGDGEEREAGAFQVLSPCRMGGV